MKREFLQNLTVDEKALPKELIDAIMAENGRDIQQAKETAMKIHAENEALKQENARLTAEAAVEGKTAQQWKDAHDRQAQVYREEREAAAFQSLLEKTISAAGGRNVKAITALLDVESLRQSQDPQKDLTGAIQKLKKEEDYLFGDQTPPPYAQGTGAQNWAKENAPTDLAGALRQKFERK